jgi:dihydrodipicolinate synthase/N-acetylneuraminate lyase
MIDGPPRGLVADLVTPFNADGGVDSDALVRLMRRIAVDAAMFRVAGYGVGEAEYLNHPDRLALLKAALAGRGTAHLLFDLTTRSEDETEDLLQQAEGLLKKSRANQGVFYHLIPLVYRSNRDLPQHLQDLGRHTRRRFILGNDPDRVQALRPGPHHKNLRTSVLKKIAANPQVAGLTFTGDLERSIHYARAVRDHRGFRFYDGGETGFLDRPSSSGVLSAGCLILSQAWADVVHSSLNIMDAQRMYPDHLNQIWQSGLAVRELLAWYKDRPARRIKLALHLMGVLPHPHPAPGRLPLDSEEFGRAKDILARLMGTA